MLDRVCVHGSETMLSTTPCTEGARRNARREQTTAAKAKMSGRELGLPRWCWWRWIGSASSGSTTGQTSGVARVSAGAALVLAMLGFSFLAAGYGGDAGDLRSFLGTRSCHATG